LKINIIVNIITI